MATIIGMDGGGTSTRAGLYFLTEKGVGACLRTAESGSANLNSNSPEQVRQNLAELLAALDPRDAVATGLGAAGITTPGVSQALQSFLRELGCPAPIVITGDYEAALCGAFGRDPGILLIAGTGSVAYGQSGDGRLARAGGYGHLIGDGGSAFAIGRALLAAYVQAVDGSRPRTPLLTALAAQLSDTPDAVMARLMQLAYRQPFDKAPIAQLARLLEPALAAGDPLARELAADGARELALLLDTVAGQLGEQEIEVVFAGGMLSHNPHYRGTLLERLDSSEIRYKLVAPRQDAVFGAAELAWRALTAPPGLR
ncbi:MAG: BadF/BadG/BcrA/BcrD ATPase family protein [Bacillota bacterium]|nr:BadF/BadG/BcrA/BcrD ATPase family protein [Bacillota bacterium]